jgi:mannose-6-phosphate isomerase-like protein (cupin superfamily)
MEFKKGAEMVRWFTDTRMRSWSERRRSRWWRRRPSRATCPPLHVHHDDDETFYVLEGRVSVITADGVREFGPGDSRFASRGVPHAYRVESERARWLVATTDGGFASFIEEMSVPADGDGYAPIDLMPSPQALGAAAARRGIEILGPPGLLP